MDEGDGGFLQLSEGFDRLIRRINRGLGYRMVEQAAAVGDGVLQVTPTPLGCAPRAATAT